MGSTSGLFPGCDGLSVAGDNSSLPGQITTYTNSTTRGGTEDSTISAGSTSVCDSGGADITLSG